MKKSQLLTLSIALLCFMSCKKSDKNEVSPIVDPVSLTDSVSFQIDGKQYNFNTLSVTGIANRAVNIKPSTVAIPGLKPAYETGGFFWYGVPDSTLYSNFYKLESSTSNDLLEISFAKRYKNTELKSGPYLRSLESDMALFKTGKWPFAVDIDKENILEGISINFSNRILQKTLSTNIPGFSILIRSALKNDIQDNSTFEITKVEQLTNGRFVVEANFEVNLFDDDEKLYRLHNGYLRMILSERNIVSLKRPNN